MYTVTSAARISNGMFESELRNDAAVPWKSACKLAGMCMSFCTLVMDEIAPPSAALDARLKETVMAGNCPWWLIESCSVCDSKCENALSGTALLNVELALPADVEPLLEFAVDVLEVSALGGGDSVVVVGV